MNKFKQFCTSLIITAKKEFDIRDLFVFGGLFLMGYGLFLLRPWLGFAVSGFILVIIGLFLGKRVK